MRIVCQTRNAAKPANNSSAALRSRERSRLSVSPESSAPLPCTRCTRQASPRHSSLSAKAAAGTISRWRIERRVGGTQRLRQTHFQGSHLARPPKASQARGGRPQVRRLTIISGSPGTVESCGIVTAYAGQKFCFYQVSRQRRLAKEPHAGSVTTRRNTTRTTVTTIPPNSRVKGFIAQTRFIPTSALPGRTLFGCNFVLMLLSRQLRSTRRAALLALGVLAVTGLAGCNTLARWGNAVFVHCAESHALAQIRHDTRSELTEQLIEERTQAAEREIELARYEAERRQLENQFCLANEEALRQQLRSNVREQLESKLAFNVTHGIEIGELEVDTEKLKEVMAQCEQPRVEPFRQPPKCPCCDEPCNCGSGHRRRHCPHCRHKPCEAEKKCGGPEAFSQLEQQPFRQPLRPAEIPMKLPVYLSFGMQQPAIERARIRQQPLLQQEPFREPFRQPCPCDAPVGGMPCVAPVGPSPIYPPPAGSPAPAGSPPGRLPGGEIRPPVPEADPSEQARRQAGPQRRVAVRLAPASSIQPATCIEPVAIGVLR